MIRLTRLNGDPIYLGAFQIESIEVNPDTRVTMASGRQVYVRESPAAVAVGMAAFWRSANAGGDAPAGGEKP